MDPTDLSTSLGAGGFLRRILGFDQNNPNNESAINAAQNNPNIMQRLGLAKPQPAFGALSQPAAEGSDMGPGGANVPMPPTRPAPQGTDLQTDSPGLWDGASAKNMIKGAGMINKAINPGFDPKKFGGIPQMQPLPQMHQAMQLPNMMGGMG